MVRICTNRHIKKPKALMPNNKKISQKLRVCYLVETSGSVVYAISLNSSLESRICEGGLDYVIMNGYTKCRLSDIKFPCQLVQIVRLRSQEYPNGLLFWYGFFSIVAHS